MPYLLNNFKSSLGSCDKKQDETFFNPFNDLEMDDVTVDSEQIERQDEIVLNVLDVDDITVDLEQIRKEDETVINILNVDDVAVDLDKIEKQDEAVLNDLEMNGDPVVFTKIEKLTPDLVEFFFKKGPSQPMPKYLPDKHFPKDKINRSFHESWYWKGDGSVTKRKWLSYSIKIDKAFCHYCVLFKTKQSNCHWTKHGFNLWKNGPAKIIMHLFELN
ncbi:uncharacterized protein LOC132933062 [Metopolophium dirhodum]|uniref:uncharacterized protein LOC132933062 n=1 Tax=Metopolophium dirhodum TaxID=44670 RepID=UPI0029905D03|nr:uncharacterized protein LOC132933062 [Metopolophium dirhodum]